MKPEQMKVQVSSLVLNVIISLAAILLFIIGNHFIGGLLQSEKPVRPADLELNADNPPRYHLIIAKLLLQSTFRFDILFKNAAFLRQGLLFFTCIVLTIFSLKKDLHCSISCSCR